MEENIKNLVGAVLVGKSSDDFLLFCKEILRQFKIEALSCEDVYCAVSRLTNNSQRVLVTGRVSQLTKENAKLIDIAKSHRHICCCLKDNIFETNKQIDHLINEPEEFLEVVKNLKGQGTQTVQPENDLNTVSDLSNDDGLRQGDFGIKRGRNFDFNKLDFAPSNAELEALLGGIEI
jgi:hypothetical protein